MPSETAHLDEATNNKQMSRAIENQIRDSDDVSVAANNWIVTAEFYAAVHYTDAVLSQSGLHPDGHGERFDLVNRRDAFTSRAATVYESLYDLSVQSRYECSQMHAGQVNSARKALGILKSELPNVG
jgi:hypothetical protein